MGIIGLSKVFSVAKSFFNKSVGSDSGSSDYKFETNFEGWAAENDLDIYADYDYDIDEEMVNKWEVGTLIPVMIFVDENDKEITRLRGEKTKKEIIDTIEGIINEKN